jgi:hypothetical protein
MKLRNLIGNWKSAEKNRLKIDEAENARQRLSYLRLKEGPVAEAVRLFSLEGGEYIEECRKQGIYDPAANDAFRETIELVDAYLRETDENATEKRYGLPDDNPFPEAEKRIAAALRENAKLVKDKKMEISGGVTPADRVAIREELK